MKLLQLAENAQPSRNLFAFDFTKLSKNDVCQVLENTDTEDEVLLRAYDFAGFDAFEFSERIKSTKYLGRRDYPKIGNGLHTYEIVVVNSKNKTMEHKIALVFGERFVYAEIFDGVELHNEGNAAKIRTMFDEISKNVHTDPDKAAEILNELDEFIYDLGVSGSITASWAEDTHYGIQNLIDALDGGEDWADHETDWNELQSAIKRRIRN